MFRMKTLALAVLCLITFSVTTVQAQVFIGLGFGHPYHRYYRPWYGPRVIVAPPRVVIGVAPAPVYLAPAPTPVYVQPGPAPVYAQPALAAPQYVPAPTAAPVNPMTAPIAPPGLPPAPIPVQGQ